MYLSSIVINNYGPLEKISLNPQNIKSNNPTPIILFGQNGTGKTLLLSNILHALIEVKRMMYDTIVEVSDNNYYRLGSLGYVNTSSTTAFNRIEFTDSASFTEVLTKDYSSFKNEFSTEKYPGVDIENQKLKESGFFNTKTAPADNCFDKEVFMFFPVERYYAPAWINTNNEKLVYASEEQRFVGKSSSNMIKYNVLNSIEEWLLDVIIDKELYEKKSCHLCSNQEFEVEYLGRNSNILLFINSFLTKLYKHKGYDSARIVITKRYGLYRQIKVIGRRGENEYEIMPTLTNMSSGEAMVLGMMASILREADRVVEGELNVQEVKGIVLIDEIDAHMHSDFIQEALPELIKFFSGIQFIVTSHSPFFLLGMKEKFDNSCNFIELPYGNVVDNLINFQEIRNCFNIVNRTYSEIFNEYEKLTEEIRIIKQPLIVTEGKTDWKHLKHALEVFHSQGLFLDVDVKFREFEDAFGKNKLDSLLYKLAMIPHVAPIIGVFDNDCREGRKYIEPQELGNNVFACCITDTLNYGDEISIELLYSREDLTRTWSDGRRLFLSDEFSAKSHKLISDTSIVSQNGTISDAHKRSIIKVVDDAVYNDEDKEIAVSKNDFATRVYERKEPYKDINVEGFKKIFETIEKIVKNQYQ